MEKKSLLENFNFNLIKYKRIENYILELENNIEIKSKKEIKIINSLKELMKEKIKHIKRLNFILYFLYFGIYFSFLSIFISNFILFNEVYNFISKIIGFFGTTIFIIGIYITNKFLEFYYQDLNLISSHLISILINNSSKNEIFFVEENSYKPFINFFKKRGF